MRFWHYKLLPYLPDRLIIKQLADILITMRAWRDKGETKFALVNQVMLYPKSELFAYWLELSKAHEERFGFPPSSKYHEEMREFEKYSHIELSPLYYRWHTNDYLKVCMAILYEEHLFVEGETRMPYADWDRLLKGYEAITGEEYEI